MHHRGSDVPGRASDALIMLTIVLLLLVVSELPAQAPGAPRQFDIPPQPLASALLAFSEQAGLQILVASRLIDNRRSIGVAGVFSPPDALAALLESQPLTFRYVSADTVAISATDRDGVDAASREHDPGQAEALTSGTH